MSYKLGSIANLISGTSTAEKGKIITNNFGTHPKENPRKTNEILGTTDNTNVNQKIEAPTEDTLNDEAKQQHFKEKSFDIQNTKPFSRTKRGGKRNVEDAELSDSDNDKSLKRKKTSDYKNIQKNIDPEIRERTIFVGNWPLTRYDKGKIGSFFGKYGKITNVRFRGIPIGDTRIPKKVAAITKNFHEQRTSLNAYVRFANKDHAIEALKANAMVIDNHHIRVSISDKKPDTDQSKSIFVGNLPFVVEEDDLWKTFSICGNIKYVRIIRDSETNASKGFAYVNFESLDSVELALQMKDVKIHNRVVRIKRSQIQKNKIGKKRDADGNKIRKNRRTEKHMNRKNNNEQQFSAKPVNQENNFRKNRKNSSEQNFSTKPVNQENSFRKNRKNSSGQNFATKPVNQENNFRGVVAERKKKKKFNKNEHQKKWMIRRILPHKNDSTP